MPETGFLTRTATLQAATYRYRVYVPPGFTPDDSWDPAYAEPGLLPWLLSHERIA